MRISGTRRFAAPRKRVWRALTDPHELGELVPGVDHVEVETKDEWVAVVRPPFGRGLSMKLDMHVTDRRPEEHARLIAWGKSLGARISIETEFELEQGGDGTEMSWTAEVRFAGLLGAFGGRGLEPIARQQAERVLDRLEKRLTS